VRRLDVVRVRVAGDHVSVSGAANRRPWRTPATSDAKEAGEAVLRKPTTGICGCCPRAVRGNATAPPRIEMEVRRRISGIKLDGNRWSIAGFQLRHTKETAHDQICIVRRSLTGYGTREPSNGTTSDLGAGILRAVLPERQLPK
jgi:hypothetical protein